MDLQHLESWGAKEPAVDTIVQIWPIASAIVLVVAVMIAWRAEITVRVKMLEEKVQTLFDLLNRK